MLILMNFENSRPNVLSCIIIPNHYFILLVILNSVNFLNNKISLLSFINKIDLPLFMPQ